MKGNLEILNSGFTDTLNVLSDGELDEITGGDFECKKNFSYKGSSLECGCGYTTSLDPTKPVPGVNTSTGTVIGTVTGTVSGEVKGNN